MEKDVHEFPEHDNKEIFRQIFDHVPVMINLTGKDRRIKLVNRAWERTIGWTLEEIRRESVDVFAECFPDPRYRRDVYDFIAAASGEWGEFTPRVRDGRVIDTTWCEFALSDGTVVGIGRDTTARKRTEVELLDSREQLRALAAHLEAVREEERARISRELHDDLGQALTGLRLELSWLNGRLARSSSEANRTLVEHTRSMIELVDRTVETVRRTATELRPGILDDFGLAAAVEWQAADFQRRTHIRCHVMASLRSRAPDRDTSTAVFRIVQEGLTNVARHARASRVLVTLRESDGHLLVEVADDGRGISEAEQSGIGSLGLLGMRERAQLLGGEFTIGGVPGRGTTLRVRLPVAPASVSPPGG